jgi:hypothetical protein
MNPRAAFFIDGFNLYHSLAAYAKESGDHSLKWLDLIGLGPNTGSGRTLTMPEQKTKDFMRLLVQPTEGTA